MIFIVMLMMTCMIPVSSHIDEDELSFLDYSSADYDYIHYSDFDQDDFNDYDDRKESMMSYPEDEKKGQEMYNPLKLTATDTDFIWLRENGDYRMAHKGPDGAFRAERKENGVVKGVYGWFDEDGKLVEKAYISDEKGFRYCNFGELGIQLPPLPFNLQNNEAHRKFPEYDEEDKEDKEDENDEKDKSESTKRNRRDDLIEKCNKHDFKSKEGLGNVVRPVGPFPYGPIDNEDLNNHMIELPIPADEESSDSTTKQYLDNNSGIIVDGDAVIIEAGHINESKDTTTDEEPHNGDTLDKDNDFVIIEAKRLAIPEPSSPPASTTSTPQYKFSLPFVFPTIYNYFLPFQQRSQQYTGYPVPGYRYNGRNFYYFR